MGRLRKLTPEKIVREAIKEGCDSIASTYNEPTITSEFSHEVFKLAKLNGLHTIYVTNGYESAECLEYLAPYLDAVNIDLKSFRDEFYSNVCGAHLQPVLDTIRRCYLMGIHTEITTLVIPQNNDSDEELTDAAKFIASVGTDIPWHISAYHDDYNFKNFGRTPFETLKRAYDIGKAAGLKFIYIGNVNAPEQRSTSCPSCGKLLIKRQWFGANVVMKKGKCQCGYEINGLFSDADNLKKPKLTSVPQDNVISTPIQQTALPDVVVLYSSMNGTSERIAKSVGSKVGCPVVSLSNITAEKIKQCKRIYFVVSTYGHGMPPSTATAFWQSLISPSLDFNNIEFSIIGVGSSRFKDTFCGFAKILRTKMIELKAHEIHDIVFRDEESAEPDSDINKFIQQL